MKMKDVLARQLLCAVLVAALISIPTSSVIGGDGNAATGTVAQPSTAPSGEGGTSATMETSIEQARQIVVYYFHGARRCKTCRTIEAYTQQVVTSKFAEELSSGALAWKVVNYDEPENKHFIKDFGLVSSAVVVVETDKGEPVRFEVLQKAWLLVRDKWRFDNYVQQSVLDYLG
jgi:hypothetical protein